MPELPEVETIRADLEPLVTGRTIVGVEVDPGTLDLLAGIPIEALRAQLVGRRIESLGRRGKYLLFGLDDGRVLVVHLRMTGRLLWRDGDAAEERLERGRFILDDGHHLRWCDQRKFGTWRVVDTLDDAVAGLGPEPIDGDFALGQLELLLQGRTAPIKAVLLDQRRLAGLGNIYVDEALFQSKIRPDTPAGWVSKPALKRLFEACRDVLLRGIEHRGASFRDYVDGQGNTGEAHMHVQVFRRTGKPCYTCGTMIERTIVGGRATHFCPRCQPKGRPPKGGMKPRPKKQAAVRAVS